MLIDDILKGDWNFDGVVITDWGAAHNTDEAIFNGLDVEMGTYTNGLTSEAGDFGYDDYYLGRAYYEKCLRGEVPDSIINDKAARILRLLFRTEASAVAAYPNGRVASDTQLAAARRIADEGIVLLKNDPLKPSQISRTSRTLQNSSAPLLPLQPERYSRILVVGENATRSLCMGGGSSELKTKVEISPLQGIRDRFGDKVTIDYAEGYRSGGAFYGRIEPIAESVYAELRAEAVKKAREADLVIFVGGLNKNHFSDCEGGDRLSYNLDFHQNELIDALAAANPRIVCVIISGNAFRMPWLSRVPALLQSWYLGSMAGAALADFRAMCVRRARPSSPIQPRWPTARLTSWVASVIQVYVPTKCLQHGAIVPTRILVRPTCLPLPPRVLQLCAMPLVTLIHRSRRSTHPSIPPPIVVQATKWKSMLRTSL